MLLPWLLCGILSITVLALCGKLWLLQKSMDEIHTELGERLSEDTNLLVCVSSRDRRLRRLAAALNDHLRQLRKQRWQYQNGDRELKEAVMNISHDLRTPLTAIRGYLDLLEREEKSAAVTRYLAFIENRTQALTQLTEELFRYSVIMSADHTLCLEATSLNRALEESVAAFYAALTARGVVPVIRMPERQITRMVDPAALSRVFSNILGNALKYSDGDLEITLRDDGMLTFANTAANLDEVQVGKMFDRFFSVEAARNSTGLGLTIARTLVEQMHGAITARYADNRLQIDLQFPAAPAGKAR